MSILAAQSPRKTVFMLVVIFVVMTAGVAAGIYLATRFGFVTWAKRVTLKATELNNSTSLRLGDRFPSFQVTGADGETVEVSQLTGGKRTILAFVSNGCEACDEFLAAARSGQIVPEHSQMILLTMEPEHFSSMYTYPSYGIDQGFLDQHSIYTSPTIIGLDKSGDMKVICSGFTELLSRDFMEQTL